MASTPSRRHRRTRRWRRPSPPGLPRPGMTRPRILTSTRPSSRTRTELVRSTTQGAPPGRTPNSVGPPCAGGVLPTRPLRSRSRPSSSSAVAAPEADRPTAQATAVASGERGEQATVGARRAPSSGWDRRGCGRSSEEYAGGGRGVHGPVVLRRRSHPAPGGVGPGRPPSQARRGLLRQPPQPDHLRQPHPRRPLRGRPARAALGQRRTEVERLPAARQGPGLRAVLPRTTS